MKLLLTFLLSFLSVSSGEVVSYPCYSYIVYDPLCNNVIDGNNIHGQRSVASISKIMTAILVIEYGMLDEYMVVGDWIRKVDGSSVYLNIGEVISIKDLLYGLMLRSGNDCAMSLAMFVSGNVPSFVDKMNSKAKEIGMNNSLFRNPSGLDADDGGNISTVYDMALLMGYAMKSDIFRKVSGTREYKSYSHGLWKNKNRLLGMYEYATGGKTGYTMNAKRTLVTSAKKGDTELIVVTFNCGGDFEYHKQLYEQTFTTYRVHKVIDVGISYIDDYVVRCEKPVYVMNNKGEKMVINYHLIPSLGNLEISTSESKEVVGMCQIIEKNDGRQSGGLLARVRKWIKGLF